MKKNKYWETIKKKSPTILAVFGSIGTGVTAYLAAHNEAIYQHWRFEYYLKNGMFPEELSDKDLSKEEIRKRAYKLLGNHLKRHISTFISGALTITSILGGNAAGKKQNASLMAMNIGIGNAIAQRNTVEKAIANKQSEEKKAPVSREEIQDYLIHEAYNNDLVYYTSINNKKENEEFVWLECYPGNKIFIIDRNDLNNLQWFINTSLKEEHYVSYGEIFDYLNIYAVVPNDFVDEDINEWIYMYGFAKDPEEFLEVEVYSRQVQMEDGTVITAVSFSAVGNVISI